MRAASSPHCPSASHPIGRIQASGVPYWADPHHRQPGKVNTNDGGRGLYWEDADGHNLEIITVPYGGWVERSSEQ